MDMNTYAIDCMDHLQEFISNEGDGEAPLEGSMPDMTSSTELVLLFFRFRGGLIIISSCIYLLQALHQFAENLPYKS